MTASDSTPPPDDQLLKEAATWFARMRGEEADAHREEFEAWLRRGALHRQAYNRASEIFAMGKHLGGGPKAPAAAEEPGERSTRSKVLISLAALLILATATWVALGGTAFQSGGPPIAERLGIPREVNRQLATRSGETREVRLEDGSVISLQGGTRVLVRFDQSARRLVLDQGTARFAVAHDPRPLVVHAGGGQIRAVGTLFDVSIGGGGRVTVRLLEGSVLVTPATDPAAPRDVQRRLYPGQTMTFATLSPPRVEVPAPQAEHAPPAQAASPADGARDYDGVTLADLVAAANRGASRPIRIADPAIGALRISGRFRIDDTSVLAERLAYLFDLTIDGGANGEIVLGSR